MPDVVADAVSSVLRERGVVNMLPGYKWGQQQAKVKEAAHAATALFVNAPQGAAEVVLGPSATALSFRLSAALGKRWGPGDAIVISELEHECNASPWREVAATRQCELRVWRARWPEGDLVIEDLVALLADGRVRFVAVTAASNCFGLQVRCIQEAAAAAHASSALLCVDSVHGAPHFLPDVQRDEIDFLLFSPYKICAPHLGAMYIRGSLVEALEVPTLHFYDKNCASKFEYGTAPYEALAGWLAALEYFASELGGKEPGAPLTRSSLERAWERVAELEAPVKAALVGGLSSIPGVKIFGSLDLEKRVGTVAFRVEGVPPEAAARALGDAGVCVGNGHFYATMSNEALGLMEGGGVVRASIAHYTSEEEVKKLISAVRGLSK